MSTEQTFNQENQFVSSNWRIWVSRILEALVGITLLIAGVLKAIDPLGFAQQITAYKIVTSADAVRILACIFILVEFILGAALLVGYKRRVAIPATFALLFLFLGALAWAWGTGATADCGCFGAWVKRTPQQALLEDLLMFGGLTAAWLLNRRESNGYRGLKLALVVIAAAASLGLMVKASHNPEQSSDPVLRLRVTQKNLFQSVAISDLSVDVRRGLYLVALIDTGCDHCQASIPAFNQIFDKKGGLPPLAAICANSPLDVKDFQKKFGPKFPIGRISDADFRLLIERGDTPRVFLLRDGEIEKIWDSQVPPENEIKLAIEQMVAQPKK